MFSEESVLRLLHLCEKYSCPIVSDEIYEQMVFEGSFKFLSDYQSNVPIIRCTGLTKKALVPGWRMGWLAFFGKAGVFDQLKKAMNGIASILLMPNTIAQCALN
jgi:tyrosine aminotransferase